MSANPEPSPVHAEPNPTAHIFLPRLHAHQLEIARHPARFKVVAAGRRFGKTKMAATLSIIHALAGHRVWWIAPSYKLALVAWRDFMKLARRVNGATILRSSLEVGFPSGGTVTIRSARDPESLRSDSLDLVIFDEAAFIDLATAWKAVIRPALMDRRGRAYFLSTPFGRNEFYRLWKRGLTWYPGDLWKSWRFKSWENPFLPPEEKASMLEEYESDAGDSSIRMQETEAEFLDEAAGVFRGVEGMLRDDISLGRPRHMGCHHVLGWDPAKFEDYNALILVDVPCRELVLLERTRRIDLTRQLDRVKEIMGSYPGVVWMDATRDETLVELAAAAGLSVEAVKFNATLKQDMVSRLAVVTERHRLKVPRKGTEILVEELRGFRYQLSKWGGGIKYGSPSGEHDDTVTAAGLCVLGMGDAALFDMADDYETAKGGKPAVFMEGVPTSGSVFS